MPFPGIPGNSKFYYRSREWKWSGNREPLLITYIFLNLGSALIRVGQTESALGEIEREYIRHGHEAMMGPLTRFLDGEMKNITRERKILENKRLDLDSCKNKVRKARGMQLQPAVRP